QETTFATCVSVGAPTDVPTWPSSPAISPAPYAISTLMPVATVDKTLDTSNVNAVTTITPPTSRGTTCHALGGRLLNTALVVAVPATETMRTYPPDTTAAARPRPARYTPRPTGRTTSGCTSPRSASPRTALAVKNTARTLPRNKVANDASPSIVAGTIGL